MQNSWQGVDTNNMCNETLWALGSWPTYGSVSKISNHEMKDDKPTMTYLGKSLKNVFATIVIPSPWSSEGIKGRNPVEVFTLV